jgi:hypothetical protein
VTERTEAERQLLRWLRDLDLQPDLIRNPTRAALLRRRAAMLAMIRVAG